MFSKSSTVIFITISTWCQSLWIFQCNGFRKWLYILQRDWITQDSFSKVTRFFSHITQSVLLVFLQGYFKKAGIQFKRNKSIPPYSWIYGEVTPLFVKWKQIWEQPHQKICLDQLRVDKRDTDCFKHMHEESTKLSVNVSTSHAWIFLSTSVFYGCYRWERRSDGTLIEWERDNDVLVGISCLFILVERKCC